MEQENYTTENRKGKHLTYEERIKLEALLKLGLSPVLIGQQLGRSERTIRRERDKGKVALLNTDLTEREEYSADVGQKMHDERATAKGPGLKIANDHKLVEYLETEIKSGKSPYAAIQNIKNNNLQFEATICFKTVYNYLDDDLFLNISNKDLPVKKNGKKRGYKHIRTAINNRKGTSISERPKQVEKRDNFGHWEMDTVVGKKGSKAVLLVLSERMTRKEMIFRMSSKTQTQVIKVLDRLEREMGSKAFRKTFKTITCDNGCENLDFEGIERSIKSKRRRTKVYYAHPYSSWERGTNENTNKLIRRFIPKGADIGKFSDTEILRIQHWINNYPRRILNGLSANMAELNMLTA